MARDEDNLARIQRGDATALFRLYRFIEPTVTYGRLQERTDVQRIAPAGWPLVRRPTGGGMVFHKEDLCLSIAWRPGATAIPDQPTKQYQWIHSLILDALAPLIRLNRMSCQQVPASSTPFHERQCFQEPVACDLMIDGQKVVGGALAHRRGAVLYQGSIQNLGLPDMEARLIDALNACVNA